MVRPAVPPLHRGETFLLPPAASGSTTKAVRTEPRQWVSFAFLVVMFILRLHLPLTLTPLLNVNDIRAPKSPPITILE